MPPFPRFEPTKPLCEEVRIWDDHVQYWVDGVEPWDGHDFEVQDPVVLWGIYWEQFNTIKIPIISQREYFKLAIAIAKVAKSREDFKRIFKETNEQRRAGLEDMMHKAYEQTNHFKRSTIFPCQDASNKVATACTDPCLESFLRILKGNAFGWEADEVELSDPIDRPTDRDFEKLWLDDVDESFRPLTVYEHSLKPEDSIAQGLVPRSKTALLKKDDGGERPQPIQRKRKSVRFDDDDSIDPHKHPIQETTELASGSSSHASSSTQQAADEGTTIIDRDNERGHKRRKLEDSAAPTPASHTSSPQPATDQRTSVKRSRRDDDDDDNCTNKRQKLENAAAAPPVPHASSIQQTEEAKLHEKVQQTEEAKPHEKVQQTEEAKLHEKVQQTEEAKPHEKVQQTEEAKRHEKGRNGRKGKKRRSPITDNSRARPPRPKSLNTRSSRRNRPAEFLELDHLGKATTLT